ncbi:MAG TPA: hypothetical protein VNW71_08105 [Thermoanaerobaculia bacterium]|nr:hypothetical protein [Thermoanaerobaculia bacterium]
MANKMRSSDHIIVVSLLVGVIILLILLREKGNPFNTWEIENLSDPRGLPSDSAYNESDDIEAQKRTVTDIRHTGTAMFSWLTDQVSAGAAGQSQTETTTRMVDFGNYRLISHRDLARLLVPTYMPAVPERDGWGHPYEFYLNVERILEPQAVMGVRSPGRDGRFSSTKYEVIRFPVNYFDEDIVWTDGYWARWP